MTSQVTVSRAKATVELSTARVAVLISRPTSSTIWMRTGAPGPVGPAGANGAAGFNYTQASPATTWTINHNLGYKPSVELFTVGGLEFEAEVLHSSNNQCVVSLLSSIAGSARLI